MTARKTHRLPSGLVEGSAEANAAEAAESARLDRELGITSTTRSRGARPSTKAALRRIGLDLHGGK